MSDDLPEERRLSDRPPDVTMTIDFAANAVLRSSYAGTISQGEVGTPNVADNLIHALNRNGERWGPPTKPHGRQDEVDLQATGHSGTLRLQITRVPDDPSLYRAARRAGHFAREGTPSQLADDMLAAIRKKVQHIPPAQRGAITLVLDASRDLAYNCRRALSRSTNVTQT